MLIRDLKHDVTPEGCLECRVPGPGKPVARIAPWRRGFETFEIRYNRVMPRTLWALEVFSRQPGDCENHDEHGFFADIPPEVRDLVRAYRFGQCAMLRYLARLAQARDLATSNPNFFWLLTAAVHDSIIDEDELPQLLRQKQKSILSRLMRPPSASVLRSLKKIELGDGSLAEARAILGALKNPVVRKIAAHRPRLSTTLLQALYQHPELALGSLAGLLEREFSKPDCQPKRLALYVSDSIRDMHRMAEVLAIDYPEQAIERCDRLAALDQLHDSWVDRVNRNHGYWLGTDQGNWAEDPNLPEHLGSLIDRLGRPGGPKWAFPEPPLPDSSKIRAIRSIDELVAEGRLQSNCAAVYARAVIDGESYIYKVLSPHRATLELVYNGETWERCEFKLSCNRTPGPEVTRVVDAWLAGYGAA